MGNREAAKKLLAVNIEKATQVRWLLTQCMMHLALSMCANPCVSGAKSLTSSANYIFKCHIFAFVLLTRLHTVVQ